MKTNPNSNTNLYLISNLFPIRIKVYNYPISCERKNSKIQKSENVNSKIILVLLLYHHVLP